jgi:hypothetical protein
MITRAALPISPLPDRTLWERAEPISRYLADERLQRRLLFDCSYSPGSYADDPWSAWEAGGCYTLAAALRPLLAPAGRLAGVVVRYASGDRVGEIEHVGIAIAGGLLDARGLRGLDEIADDWAEVVAVDRELIQIVPLSAEEERSRYRGLLGSEPTRIEALRRLLARDLADPLRALRATGESVGRPSRA